MTYLFNMYITHMSLFSFKTHLHALAFLSFLFWAMGVIVGPYLWLGFYTGKVIQLNQTVLNP